MEHRHAGAGRIGRSRRGGRGDGAVQPLRPGLQGLHQLLRMQAHRSGGARVRHEGRSHPGPRRNRRRECARRRISDLLQRPVRHDGRVPGEAVVPPCLLRQRAVVLRAPCAHGVRLHHERHGGAAGALRHRHQPLQALHQEADGQRAPGAVLLQHLAVSSKRVQRDEVFPRDREAARDLGRRLADGMV